MLIQMGHNDGGALDDTNRARGSIRGLGEDSKDIFNPITKKPETVHTSGWYLRKYINDAHAKGMTAILCTPIPHCPNEEVHAGDVEKSDFVRVSTAVAENEKIPLINLNQIVMGHYARMSPKEIKEKYFTPAGNTHTSLAGAELERFKKYCSHSEKRKKRAVFLVFGFVSAQLQGFTNLRLRRSLAKNQNPRSESATIFFKPL